MNTLEKLAKRIGEIGDEIKELKLEREVNLQHCHASDDTDFGSQREDLCSEWDLRENCLQVAYRWARDELERCQDEGEIYNPEEFYHTLINEGCENCKAAYEAKRKIGKLKQERGRLVGNISKIGKSL